MRLESDSPLACRLSRALLEPDLVVASVVFAASYRLDAPARALPTASPVGPIGALSWGTSVTLAGTVVPARVGDRTRQVSLAFGPHLTQAMAVGRRSWIRRGDDLEASAPEVLEPLALGASLAFGGAYREPPGEIDGCPHPGFVVHWQTNPEGIGFYRSRDEAEGRPLPRIELDGQQVRRWADRPEPALFAPCPSVVAARMPTQADLAVDAYRGPLILQHLAPRRHIVERLAPGARVAVEGFGGPVIRFELPSSPLRVSVKRGVRRETVGASIRHVHVDADARVFTCIFGHGFGCSVETMPRVVTCQENEPS